MARNACTILEVAKRADIPVHIGAAVPIVSILSLFFYIFFIALLHLLICL